MMRNKGRNRRILAGTIAAMILILVLGGCSSLKKNQGSAGETPVAPADKGPVPLYLDFGDVLIPHELSVEKDSSFVFRTPGTVGRRTGFERTRRDQLPDNVF